MGYCVSVEGIYWNTHLTDHLSKTQSQSHLALVYILELKSPAHEKNHPLHHVGHPQIH